MKKNYTSRFKILKGGKISLMVSALLVGVTTSSLEAVSALNTISLDEEGKSYVNNEDKSNTKVVISKNNITYTNNKLLDNYKDYLNGESAIHVNNSVENFSLINKGTIQGGETSYDDTIYFDAISNSTITNDDTIKGAYGGSAIFVMDSKDINITNNGTIEGSDHPGDYKPLIKVEGTNTENIYIKNAKDAKIVVSTFNKNGFNAIEVNKSGGTVKNLQIDNQGEIIGGIDVRELARDSSIKNSGDITAVGNNKEKSYAIYVNTNDGAVEHFAGTIKSSQVGIRIENNNGSLHISKGANLISDERALQIAVNEGEVLNEGTISSDKYAIFMQTNNSKIVNEISGEINGSIITDPLGGSKGYVENNGKINLGLHFIKMDGVPSLEYQMAVNDFRQTSTGILQIKVDNSKDPKKADYSQVIANKVTLEDGSTIDFNVTDDSNESLLSGQTLQNVIQTEDLTVNLDKLKLTDNSALLKFEAELDNETKIDAEKGLDIKIKQEKTIEDAIENINPNIAHVGKIFDKMKNKDLDSFISSLNKKATDKEVTKAIKETTPVVAAALASTSNQVQETIGSVISGRQLGIRGLGTSTPSGLNSGDDITSDYSAWTKIFGAKAKQDDKNSYDGYDFDSYGMAFGADKEFGENKRFGLSFVYANGEVKTNNVEQKSDLDIYNLVTYGSTPVFDKDTVLFYQLSLGTQETETKRKETTTGTTAKGDFRGFLTSASTRLIRNIKIDDTLLVVPTLKAMYTYMRNPSYKESGAGALNLNVDKFSSSSFQMGMGVDMEYKLTNDYTLLSNAMINYDLKEGKNVSSSSYAGDSSLAFTTQGMKSKRFSYEAGVGIKRVINEDSNLRFEYNYEGRDSSFSNQTVSLKYSWKF